MLFIILFFVGVIEEFFDNVLLFILKMFLLYLTYVNLQIIVLVLYHFLYETYEGNILRKPILRFTLLLISYFLLKYVINYISFFYLYENIFIFHMPSCIF